MKKFIQGLGVFFNIISSLLLILTKLTGIIGPQSLAGVIIYGLGLAFPILLLFNLFYVFYWAYRLKWYAIISLICLVLVYPEIKTTIPIQTGPEKIVPPKAIKVLTNNVGIFVHGKDGYYESINQVFKFIEDEQPDLLCLQEIRVNKYKRTRFDQDSLYNRMKAYPYSYIKFKRIGKSVSSSGIAIFSKFPIVNKGDITFRESTFNLAVFADVRVGDHTVRMYGVHFESNRLHKLDKEVYDEVLGGNKELLKKEIKFLSKNMRKAARKRAFQVEDVQRHIEQSPHPVIIMGDFNDSPVTFTYKHLRKGKDDAFMENGSGLGITYNGNYPAFRIDYILYSNRLKSYDFKRHNDQKFSDHFPISTYIEFPE